MSWFSRYLRSSVGAKHIVAITGLVLVSFLLAHLAANLLIFVGRDALNAYGVSLRELGGGTLIWVARGGLLLALVVHVAMSLRLAVLNAAARPVKYARFKTSKTHFYAKWMATTGLLLFAFIVFHLLHYTFFMVNPEYGRLTDPQGRHDAYSMVILGFSSWAISLSYIVAMGLLAMHLAHGVSSFFQSLGLNHPKYNRGLALAGPVVGLVLFVGFVSIPVAVLAGLVVLPGA
jgi:succinate dehydrogenase / fumarate reductase, cytochrome b subunit